MDRAHYGSWIGHTMDHARIMPGTCQEHAWGMPGACLGLGDTILKLEMIIYIKLEGRITL